MKIQIKTGEIWLLLLVSVMALAANLPDSVIGRTVDRNLLLIALSVTVFISLFRYLRLMLFITVSIMAIGANLPDQLATQIGISRTAMIVASGVLVVVSLLYKLYHRKADEEEHGVEIVHEAVDTASHLRDSIESRVAVISAILNGDFAGLHQQLVADVEVNFSQNGNIPIFLAIEKGNADMVVLLLVYGAKLRIKNQNGLTPIDLALKLRFARIAKILHYADVQNMAIQNRAIYSSQRAKRMPVLFADICGSTALYELLGNENALNVITRSLNILIREAAKHRGTLVKTIGDEIMCTFPTVALAAQAARAMHFAIDAGKPGGEHIIAVRIGLHYGDVIIKANDVFGDTVNVAARIASITRARQTMTTQEVVDELPEEFEDKVLPITRASLRGKQDALTVYELLWEADDSASRRMGDSMLRKTDTGEVDTPDNLPVAQIRQVELEETII